MSAHVQLKQPLVSSLPTIQFLALYPSVYLGVVVGEGDWHGEGAAGAGEGLLGRLSISNAGDTQPSDLCLDIRYTITICTITFLVPRNWTHWIEYVPCFHIPSAIRIVRAGGESTWCSESSYHVLESVADISPGVPWCAGSQADGQTVLPETEQLCAAVIVTDQHQAAPSQAVTSNQMRHWVF